MKIQKKNFFFFFLGGGVWGGGGRVGGGGGEVRVCERRIEFFVKIQKKKNWGVGGSGWWGGVRVYVNKVLKFL